MKECSFDVANLLAWCKRVRPHAGEHVVRFQVAASQVSACVFDRECWCEGRTPFLNVPQSGDDGVWFAPIELLIDALAAASAQPEAGGTLTVVGDQIQFEGGGVKATMPLAVDQLWWSPPKPCEKPAGATLGQLTAVVGFTRDQSFSDGLAVVRVEHDAVVATDKARIGWIETQTDLDADDAVNVPSSGVKSADKFLPSEADVMIGDGVWAAEHLGDRFTGVSAVSAFLPWRNVVDRMVPKEPGAGGRRPFMVSRRDLSRALTDLMSKSFDPVVAVHLNFVGGDRLVVSRRAIEGGFVAIELILPERFDGPDLSLTFQCSTLRGSLRAWKSDAVVMWAGAPAEPTMWWSDDDLKFIQTPVKEIT